MSSHHQILKSALSYLRTHVTQHPQTEDWLLTAEREQSASNLDPLQRLLVRSLVDADYQDDLWLQAWYYKPFAGGKTETFAMLTSLYHFTNVTKPGRYWRYDGYAYRNTEGIGNDGFLGLLGLHVRVDLSKPMQKYTHYQTEPAMADTTLPPSYLIAIDAFAKTISSDPSLLSQRETWKKELLYADDYVLTSGLEHQFAFEEIRSIPTSIQQLGIAMHMAQDLAVPHHAQGIGGLCHTDFEQYVDEILCTTKQKIDAEVYDRGVFDEIEVPECQALDDVNAVEKLMAHDPIFSIYSGLSLEDRLIQLAKKSAEWKVSGRDDRASNAMKLTFRGQVLFSGSCEELGQSRAITLIAQHQYQLATAATIMILELAAYEYAQRWLRIAQMQSCDMCDQFEMSC